MYQVIYSKRYEPVERKAEKWEDFSSPLSTEEEERLIRSAIDFSKSYKQGIDIIQRGKKLSIDLYITDHFFMGRGKERLAYLFAKANRVDFSVGGEDVLLNFYYQME